VDHPSDRQCALRVLVPVDPLTGIVEQVRTDAAAVSCCRKIRGVQRCDEQLFTIGPAPVDCRLADPRHAGDSLEAEPGPAIAGVNAYARVINTRLNQWIALAPRRGHDLRRLGQRAPFSGYAAPTPRMERATEKA